MPPSAWPGRRPRPRSRFATSSVGIIRADAKGAIWAILGRGTAIAIAGAGASMIADYTLGWM